jgi:sodium-dependent dicarboxylate transporter 2/3/5
MNRRRLAFWLPPAAALLLFAAASRSTLEFDGRATLAVALLMAGWWLAEALPLAATALVPIAAFPLLGVMPVGKAAAPYAHKLIFLFLGGFLIAAAMERWNLHRRIALETLARVGDSPRLIVAAFMGVTAFLSLWVSNTATALMMLSIATSVVAVTGKDRSNFGTCLVLGIAYAASIGGMGSLVGTPPNAILAAFVEQSGGEPITFTGWFRVGLPVAAVLLPICWFMLTRYAFPIGSTPLPGGAALIERERSSLGPMGVAERRVLVVFVSVAAAWCLRPLFKRAWPGLFGGLDDAVIAMLGALALFALPSGEKEGGAVLDWRSAEAIPWGVLLLFGGGLSLASAITQTGVADYIGSLFSGLRGTNPFVLILLVAWMIVFLTEVTSNTATTAAFVPIFAAMADGAGLAPMSLLIPTALGASCAFMMPVATPPNAIVFASGLVTIPQMFRAGFFLNLISILVIALWTAATVG